MTLPLAIIIGLLILLVRPLHGICIYAVALMWYPNSLTVKVGTIDFSVGRIAIIVLFLKLLSSGYFRGFKWNWLDKTVVIFFIGQILAGITTTPFMKLLENRSGDFFDMALPFFAIRLIVNSKEDMLTFIKAVAISSAFLGMFAFFESITGKNLLSYGRPVGMVEKRMGLFRSQLAFAHPIYSGVCLGMVATFCTGIVKNVKNNKGIWKVVVFFMFLGCFSSMSSGGLMTMAVGLILLVCYRWRHKWKLGLKILVISCLLVEVISNRHFYDVIDRFTFNAQTAWYRTRLFEVAFFESGMSGHWLCGYGFEDPMWCKKIDGRAHTDMVNHYLLILCRNGLMGFIPFIMIIVLALKRLYAGFLNIKDDSLSWLIWCLGASIWAVLCAFNSVSLFGQPMSFLYMLFGLCCTPFLPKERIINKCSSCQQ